MRRLVTILLVIIAAAANAQEVDRIMFGSCLVQTRAHPILSVVLEREPAAFIFLGDNVYADSDNPDAIRRAYEILGSSPLVREVRRTTEVLAIWDDHDYGRNDAGREFPAREASEAIFESVWDVSGAAAERPGIYRSVMLGTSGRRIQVVLLDTRFFRSPLPRAVSRPAGKGPYGRDGGTLLGEAQWAWLEQTLREPADFRIIASSIQVLAEHHGWESWANFPDERARLLSLLGDSDAPLVIISGDRHFAEISRRTVSADEGRGVLVDITSSAINRRYPEETPTANDRRVGGYYLDHNVGELEFVWPDGGGPPIVHARILDETGDVRLSYELKPEGSW
ncbi:MAG: alkaline phosphatase D family protein [Spirochaetota bacterium]